MYARHTGAVPSGRRVSERPAPSSNEYISFWTMSVASPTPRANNSVASNVGVSIRWYRAAENPPRVRLDLLAPRLIGRQHVEGPARGLDHGRLAPCGRI